MEAPGAGDERADPATVGAVVPPRRRHRQVGLRTPILIVAAAAVVCSIVSERRRIAELIPRVEKLRRLARELVVVDPTQLAAVQVEPLWDNDDRWNVYLPPGGIYRLCLATRAIDTANITVPISSATIGPGDHEIACTVEPAGRDWWVRATVDGKPKLAAEEPAAWKTSHSTSGGGVGGTTEPFPIGRPVVLTRRRFLSADPSGSVTERREPGPGILLWIEATADPAGPRP